MVDIDSRHIVDLLESREIREVTDWLKSYPNLEVVSRDGSVSYAAAIKDSHPEAIQVSDRFHLFKNLTDYCKEYIQGTLGAKIQIPADTDGVADTIDNGYYTKSKEDKINRVQDLYSHGHTSAEISKQLKMDIRTVKKYVEISQGINDSKDKDTPQTRHEAAVLKKQANIAKVRELHGQGYSLRNIAKITGLSRQTVTKYLDENVSAIHGLYGTRAGGPLTPFHNDIDSLLEKGWTFKNIETQIREEGYTGSSSAIRMYTSAKRRRMKQTLKTIGSQTEIIERKSLIQLLYKPMGQIKNLTLKQLSKVIKMYPNLNQVYDIVESFKRLVLGRNVEDLEEWILKAKTLGIAGIDSFANGIVRDIDAVTNAIVHDYSNGLAEGSVNKLKVIKRIMYGRCSFDMLRKKVLRLEGNRRFN